MSTEIELIKTEGIEMEYFKFGTGSKALAILPGLAIKSVMLSADVIVRVFSAFAEDFTVYVFDRRKNLPSEYTVEDMAKDQIKAFDALGIKSVSLYGISQGGMIALNIAILRPDLVSSMVLGSTASRLNDMAVETIGEWYSLAKAHDEPALIESFGSRVFSAEFYGKFGDIIRDSVKGITPEEFERLVILTGKMDQFGVYDRLGEIRCPVLVMGGSDDNVLGIEASEEIAEKIGCEIYVFDGYGHAVYDETDEFKAKAKKFLINL